MTNQTLTNLVTGMAEGSIRVVDLTVPLSAATPVIGLPGRVMSMAIPIPLGYGLS